MNRSFSFASALFMFLLLPFLMHGQSFKIEDFDVSIKIDSNGFFMVNERINVDFLERSRGIFRDIPFRFKNQDGTALTTPISNIVVKGEDKQVTRQNGVVRIRIGNPNKYHTGNRVYDITYRVDNAFLYLEDRVEFYWNITGYWEVPMASASYRIEMPDDFIIPDEDMTFFTGPEGSTEKNATIAKVGRIVQGRTTQQLEPKEGVTVALNLPQGYIKKMEVDNRQSADSYTNDIDEPLSNPKDYGGFLLAGIAALFVGFFRKFGWNKKPHEVAEQYYPPENMSSAEVGTFIDYSANTRDLISLVPKWGNEGFIEINSIPDHKGERDIYFFKKKDLPSDAPEYERTMFDGIFQHGDQVFLTDLKDKYYTVLIKAQTLVKKDIQDPKLYDDQAKKYFHSIWSIFALPVFLATGIFLIAKYKFLFSGIGLIIFGIVIFVIKFLRPKLSQEGQRLQDHLVGLQSFLKNPDPEKINELMTKDSKYLDYIFPYVVALGLDKSWNKAMSKSSYASYSPPWYIYHGTLGTTQATTYSDFTESFNVKTISSVFASAPQSAGGSGGGFSGGSSGGGFGGGGGGSW